MRADDLLAMADQPVGAEIPVGDMPLGIEHEDGVIGDALHQQAEFLLAAAQRLGLAPGAFGKGAVVDGGGKADDQDADGGAGDEEGERLLPHRAAGSVQHEFDGQEVRALHRGVMHAGDRRAHDDAGGGALQHAGGVEGEPQRDEGGADGDGDGGRDPPGIVVDGGGHPHRGHAGVVHAGDGKPHAAARDDQRLRPLADDDEGGGRDQDRDRQRQQRQQRIVGDGKARQAEGQHGDEMHRPDAAAHGDRCRHQPAEAGRTRGRPHPRGEIERRVGSERCDQDRQRDENGIVGT